MIRSARRTTVTAALAALATCLTLAAGATSAQASAPATAPARPAAAARPAVEPLPPAATPVDGSYRAIAPARLLDTRVGHHTVHPSAVLSVKVLGVAGVPAANVSAVMLHVTVTDTVGPGYLTVYPSGSPIPSTSTLNYAHSRTMVNSVLVAPGPDGQVAIRNALDTTDVIVDLLGWVAGGAQPAPGAVQALPPTRLYDSRSDGHKVLTSAGVSLPIAGKNGVPDTAAAAILNVTVVGINVTVPVTVWPAGGTRPVASSVNSWAQGAVANQVTAALGTGGAINFAVYGAGSTHLVVDLVGYVAGGTAGPSALLPIAPKRIVDTRATRNPFPAGSTRAIHVTGGPANAAAALVTITAVQGPGASGYLTAYANGAAKPATSDLNPSKLVPVATQVLVPLGPDGSFALTYQAGYGQVVIDVNGYLAAAQLPAVAPTALSPDAVAPSGEATTVLQTANRYALNTWWPTTAPKLLKLPFDQSAQSSSQDQIRRVSMEAFSLAVSLSTGAYVQDQAATNPVSKAAATSDVVTIVTAVACSHLANRVGGWGSSWQSSMWDSYAGRAAWLLWADLPAATKTCVQRMVISEANYVGTLTPRYMLGAEGQPLTPGNTGAEENSWYALAPALAVAMMPSAEQRDAWRQQEEQLLIASWARPADVTSSTTVDGKPLSSWLAGSNVNPDGVVINHTRIAPDYSTNVYQSVDTLEMAVLGGRAAPQASLFGLGPVYAAMSTTNFTNPPYKIRTPQLDDPSAGTIYVPGSALIYYPQGCDWGTGQELPYALMDTDANVFGFADGTDAAGEAKLHLDASAALQAATPTGQMYTSTKQYSYVGAEEHTAQLAAQTYLAGFIQQDLTVQVTAQPISPSRDEPSARPSHAPVPVTGEAAVHRS